MKIMKRTIAILLALIIASSSMVCFAADGEKQYRNYEKVLLLGDSEASGFTDYGNEMSEFTYVADSYAAYVAEAVGADVYYPMACPGFRTMELRYLIDDTYRPDDQYLFTEVPRTPKEELIAKGPAVKAAIAESDLIMIGIGGNDWGAYLGWVMEDVQLENNLPEDFKAALSDFLKTATFQDDIIGQIIQLADYFNALDDLALALPEAMEYAFSNLWANWEWLVEYIYENNPDVTLVVVGMFPTYLKTEEGAPDVVIEPDPLAVVVEDAIIAYGNKHMIENQDKYGYLYVDTAGTIVEVCHPTVAGHRHIADRILEALPDASATCTADVPTGASYFKAVEYMVLNGIMEGTSETTFSPDEALTRDVLSVALNKITGNYTISDSTSKVSGIELGFSVFKCIEKKNLTSFFEALTFALQIIVGHMTGVTRGEAAEVLYRYITTFC